MTPERAAHLERAERDKLAGVSDTPKHLHAGRVWRIIRLDDGSQWLTDGDCGIAPSDVPQLKRELNERTVALNVALDERDALRSACEQVLAQLPDHQLAGNWADLRTTLRLALGFGA